MTAEIVELQDSARRVLAGLGIAAPEEKTWPLIVDLGWLLVAVPEELGGLGQGLAAACTLYRELGSAVAAAPFLPAMLAMDAVCQSGIADREGWVERIAGGANVVTSTLAPSALTAVTVGAGRIRVSGRLSAAPCADKASHLLVAVGGCVAFVALDQPNVARVLRPTWDVTRRLFDVELTDVELDDKLVLASGPSADALARRLATHRDFALAADSVGGTVALLDMTVDYLQTRRQFSRPLAMFQALKHRCADLKALTTAAEALLQDGLNRSSDAVGDADSELMGKQAKSFASTVYSRVAEEALQLHGGIGMTSEHCCHRFLKRALLNAQLGLPADRYDLDIADAVLAGF